MHCNLLVVFTVFWWIFWLLVSTCLNKLQLIGTIISRDVTKNYFNPPTNPGLSQLIFSFPFLVTKNWQSHQHFFVGVTSPFSALSAPRLLPNLPQIGLQPRPFGDSDDVDIPIDLLLPFHSNMRMSNTYVYPNCICPNITYIYDPGLPSPPLPPHGPPPCGLWWWYGSSGPPPVACGGGMLVCWYVGMYVCMFVCCMYVGR